MKARPDAAKQAVATIQAAYKIQTSCYGPGHPLVLASKRAAAAAAKGALGK